jgi:type II secretory pathway component PulK
LKARRVMHFAGGRGECAWPECSVRRTGERVQSIGGSVLILALWTLFFLGALAVAVGASVSGSLRLAERMRNDLIGWSAAKAGIERAACEATGDTNDWDSLNESWADQEKLFRNIAVGTGRYSVSWEDRSNPQAPVMRYGMRDEDGKINIRICDTNVLEALFTVAGGLSEPAAAQLARAVAEYRSSSPSMLTQSPATGYSSQDSTNSTRFGSVYELRLVPGVTEEVFSKVEPFVTVYTGERNQAQVNLNTAEMAVLLCIARARGVEEPSGIAQLIMDFRKAGNVLKPGSRGMSSLWKELVDFDPKRSALHGAFLSLARGNLVTTKSTCFSGLSEGWSEGHTGLTTRIRFVFDRRTGTRRFWYEE